MALAARQVLRDCQLALDIMDQETHGERLRLQWIGALALVRLVGHVLKDVDGKSDNYKSPIAKHWNKLQDKAAYPIFWEFIKGSRDLALKEYQIPIWPASTVLLSYDDEHGQKQFVPMTDCVFSPLTDGYRAGSDARDAYRDAILWWNEQLSEIEGQP
jgi:hypothetical protein